MSESRGFGAGDERLGRVLRDAVEGRGRPATASLTGAGIGPRAFAAAVERSPEHRRTGERPRFGAIAVTAILGAAAATALALWPAVSGHRPPAAPRTEVAASPAAATLPAAPASASSPADAATAGVAAPAAQPPPAPPAAGASQPAAAPAAAPAEKPVPTSTPATPAPTPLPPLTFANHEVVGCC